MRHQILTFLTAQGLSDTKLQLFSGHQSRKSLELYQHLSFESVEVEYQQAVRAPKRPVSGGYSAAAELFKAGKFPQAQKEFEKIIASGTADVNTHLCLAHCFLHEKVYSKAIKEFEWLGKYAKNSMSLQKSCQATARSLRNAMNGICQSTCLKGHDPRWTLKAGAKVILVPHNGGGYDTLTPNDIGHSIVYEHGNAVVKGICPVCEGTTQVPVLKPGGPMPRI